MQKLIHRKPDPDMVYFAFAGTIALVVSAIHLFDPLNIYSYLRDVWHHTAAINALMDSPFAATNPHVVSDEPSRTFMPWFVMLAILGKAFGMTATQVLGLSALVTMVTLMAGVRLFATTYFKSKWAPVLLFAALIGGWGIEFNYAGLSNMETLVVSASYPFAIVLALGFIGWWAVLKLLEAESLKWGLLILIATLSWFMLITHQMQAGLSIGGMLLFAGFYGKATLKRRATIIAAVIIGAVLTRYWIYYDPIAYMIFTDVKGWETGAFWYDNTFLFFMSIVALFGVFGFYDYEKKKLRLDLLVGTGAIFAGFVIGGIIDNPVSHRFFPFWILFLQLGLVAFLLSWPAIKDRGGAPKVAYIITAPLFSVLVLFHIYFGINYYFTFSGWGNGTVQLDYSAGDPEILQSITGVSDLVGPEDVIIGNYGAAYPAQAYHMKVVSIPRPFPLVHDMAQRQQASIDFFKSDISNQRRSDIIAKYNVTHILYRMVWTNEAIRKTLDAFGEKHVFNNDLVLIVIDLERETRPNSQGTNEEGSYQ